MSKDNYLCVDAVLSSSPNAETRPVDPANPGGPKEHLNGIKDCRKDALALLKIGASIGMLDLSIGIVARRFALREQAVRDWYKAKLLEEGASDGKK